MVQSSLCTTKVVVTHPCNLASCAVHGSPQIKEHRIIAALEEIDHCGNSHAKIP